MDSQHSLPDPSNWLQMLWLTVILPFFVFLNKKVREWVVDRFKPKERREDVITRAEFEARHVELKSDMRNGFDDFGNKLDAHSAQARVDNRELKAELKADIHELKHDMKDSIRDVFLKIDNFLAMLKGK